jgi:hypothetical protein
MTYEDIKVNLQPKQSHFITSLFCAINPSVEEIGCNCGRGFKCKWMDHWLAQSMKALPYYVQNLNAVPKAIEEQIKKDVKRTQPYSKTFQSEQYQNALYQCLMVYARIDP